MESAIIKILKSWENMPQHNGMDMWLGYEALMDELKSMGIFPSMRELKATMKKLKELNTIELLPTYDYDYRLCGSGYFICQLHA